MTNEQDVNPDKSVSRRDVLKTGGAAVATPFITNLLRPFGGIERMDPNYRTEPLVNLEDKLVEFSRSTNSGYQIKIEPKPGTKDTPGELPKMSLRELLGKKVVSVISEQLGNEGISLDEVMGEGGNFAYPWWQVYSEDHKGGRIITEVEAKESDNKKKMSEVLSRLDRENVDFEQVLFIPPYAGKVHGMVIWGRDNEFKVKRLDLQAPVQSLDFELISNGVAEAGPAEMYSFGDKRAVKIPVEFREKMKDQTPLPDPLKSPYFKHASIGFREKGALEEKYVDVMVLRGGEVIRWSVDDRRHLNVEPWSVKEGKFLDKIKVIESLELDAAGKLPVYALGDRYGVVGVTWDIAGKGSVVMAIYDDVNYREQVHEFKSMMALEVAAGIIKPEVVRKHEDKLKFVDGFADSLLSDEDEEKFKKTLSEKIKKLPSMVLTGNLPGSNERIPLFIAIEHGNGKIEVIENPNLPKIPYSDIQTV